jgi:hypothetical protein
LPEIATPEKPSHSDTVDATERVDVQPVQVTEPMD